MAKSTLQQLFDGEIYPSENVSPDTPEYNEAKKALAEEKEYFLNTLSGEDRERFIKIDDLYYDISGMYGYECFAHGFRLAIALMVESLKCKDCISKGDEENG